MTRNASSLWNSQKGWNFSTISLKNLILVILLVCLFNPVEMVKRGDFKTCEQSSFCARQRAYGELVTTTDFGSPYRLDPATLKVHKNKISAKVMQPRIGKMFDLELYLLKDGVVRIKMSESDYGSRGRFDLLDDLALTQDAMNPVDKFQQNQTDNGLHSFDLGNGVGLNVWEYPLRIDMVVDGDVVMSLNQRGFLNIEHIRPDGDKESITNQFEGLGLEDGLKSRLEKDQWEENFNGKPDSKPFGPMSVGFDISFPDTQHVYGLPEHASSFALKTTIGEGADYTDPFRLYNLDVFEYELDNPMALYGSIPMMIGHNKKWTGGMLWLNAAEMWIDVAKPSSNSARKILNKAIPNVITQISPGFLKYVPKPLKKLLPRSWVGKNVVQAAPLKEHETPAPPTLPSGIETHWMAESGLLDVFLFPGGSGKDSWRKFFAQYARVTGTTTLPNTFSIAYHQCRWNYNDEEDVESINTGFDKEDIPMDVIWLDIEHTDGKRYFTWDKIKFPTPKEMQQKVSSRGRKMVTIVDPHMKRDGGYSTYSEAQSKGLLVKNKDGSEFDGWCWPGSSSWPDYINPDARSWWATQFALDKYEGSTLDLYTWNDMNEPSVFTGPEITMPKDLVHYKGWEHRDVHNIYGTMLHRATYEGQLARTSPAKRPFILSRAFFIGTQRYGAIWTGDNMAQWDHLQASIPMLLSVGAGGIAFAGADVGGFFHNPEADLLTRWFQAGAFQPFFRGHAHLDTRRREPWVMGEPYTSHIRSAIRKRYALLPYFYTLFWEASLMGMPVMRSMAMEYPDIENLFAMDDQFMVGSGMVVKPVVTKDETSVVVHLPNVDRWFDYDTFAEVKPTNNAFNQAVTLDKIPVYLRGGYIIPRRERVRRSSSLMKNDPYTLLITLDKQQRASGILYADDGVSFAYQTRGAYVARQFTFANGELTSKVVDPQDLLSVVKLTKPAGQVDEAKAHIERIVLIGLDKKVSKVSLRKHGASKDLSFDSHYYPNAVSIKDPSLTIGESDWTLSIV